MIFKKKEMPLVHPRRGKKKMSTISPHAGKKGEGREKEAWGIDGADIFPNSRRGRGKRRGGGDGLIIYFL